MLLDTPLTPQKSLNKSQLYFCVLIFLASYSTGNYLLTLPTISIPDLEQFIVDGDVERIVVKGTGWSVHALVDISNSVMDLERHKAAYWTIMDGMEMGPNYEVPINDLDAFMDRVDAALAQSPNAVLVQQRPYNWWSEQFHIFIISSILTLLLLGLAKVGMSIIRYLQTFVQE